MKEVTRMDVGCSVGMWSIAALTCGAKKVYGFDPLIENKVANDDRLFDTIGRLIILLNG